MLKWCKIAKACEWLQHSQKASQYCVGLPKFHLEDLIYVPKYMPAVGQDVPLKQIHKYAKDYLNKASIYLEWW